MPEAVGQPAIVEHLEEHVEHVAVRLLHLVQQDHGVRPPSHGLREQSPLLVADVPRGRADQTGNGVLLHELAHVDPHHRVLVVEQHLGERLAELRLPHAGGPEEDERSDRPVRVLEPGPAAADGVAHRLDRLLLPHHPLVEPLLEHEQLGPLGLHQPRHGDAGPGADDLGDLLGADLAAQQPLRGRLARLLLGPLLLQSLLQGLPLHVELVEFLVHLLADELPGGLPLLDLHAGLVERQLHRLELLAQFLGAAHAALLRFPLLSQVGELLPQPDRLRFDLRQPLLGMLLGLLGELPGRELELHEPPLHLVDLAGHALQFHGDAAGRLVHEVDRLVGQEAVGDVAVRKLGGGHERRVLDLHPLVVCLIPRLEAAEDGDRVLHARLADEHRLKPPLQGRVFLDVLAILIERRGADAPQFAAGQRRLEQVGGVGAPLRRARPDDRVQLVDEQNHVPGRRLHLPQDRLQPILELAAILGAGDQRAQVERHHTAATQVLRHVRLHDPQGQPLGDRRLAHARLADEHGVVLGPPRQHLDHAADLGIAADHRIEFALGSPLREVDAVFLESLKLLLRILVRDPRLAAYGLQPRQQFLLADGRQLEDVLRLRGHLGQGEQEVVGGDELVLHLVRLGRRRLEDLDQFLVGLRLGAAGDLGQVGEFGRDDPLQVSAVGPDLLQQRPHDPLTLAEQRVQEMDRRHLRIAAIAGQLHGGLHRLLGLDRELVESKRHDVSLLHSHRYGTLSNPCPRASGPGRPRGVAHALRAGVAGQRSQGWRSADSIE